MQQQLKGPNESGLTMCICCSWQEGSLFSLNALIKQKCFVHSSAWFGSLVEKIFQALSENLHKKILIQAANGNADIWKVSRGWHEW